MCSKIFKPEESEKIQNLPKYDASCAPSIAMHKYMLGNSFTRIERYQAMLGIPLAKATQWDLVNDLATNAYPVYVILESLAAQSHRISYDDTPKTILESPIDAKNKSSRTTAIIAEISSYKITLFYTSDNVAGDNIEELLTKRTVDTNFITMTDASSSNFSDAIPLNIMNQMIICFCLIHGRRNFYKILDFYRKECDFVLNCISVVYKNEKYCKKHNLNYQDRLKYHQKHSKPVMDGMRTWLNNKLLYKEVEPNSALGSSMRYMLKHWSNLTKFLVEPGAMIDNNHTERVIKTSILHSKNSLFYKTANGAKVGDILMSLIQTAIANDVNAFDYLVAINKNCNYSAQFS